MSQSHPGAGGRWAYFGEFLLDVLAVFGIVAGGFLLAKLIEVLS